LRKQIYKASVGNPGTVLGSTACVLVINPTCSVLANIPCMMNMPTSVRQKLRKKSQQDLRFIRSLWGTHVTSQRTLWYTQPAGDDLTPSVTGLSAEIPRMLSRAALLKEGPLTEAAPSGTNLARFLISRSYSSRKNKHDSLSVLLIGRQAL